MIFGNGYDCGNGFFGMGGFMIIPTILIIIGIYFIFSNNSNRRQINREDALSLLDQKYVNDEISEEDYQHRKEFLRRK